MNDLRDLAQQMKLGKLIGWDQRAVVRLGELLGEALDELELLTADGVDDRLREHTEMVGDEHRLRDILVAFGALSSDDRATGLLDLVEVLLPPREP